MLKKLKFDPDFVYFLKEEDSKGKISISPTAHLLESYEKTYQKLLSKHHPEDPILFNYTEEVRIRRSNSALRDSLKLPRKYIRDIDFLASSVPMNLVYNGTEDKIYLLPVASFMKEYREKMPMLAEHYAGTEEAKRFTEEFAKEVEASKESSADFHVDIKYWRYLQNPTGEYGLSLEIAESLV
jgi:hypothetical protein